MESMESKKSGTVAPGGTIVGALRAPCPALGPLGAGIAIVVACTALAGCEPEVDISPPKPAADVQPNTPENWASLPLAQRLLGVWTVNLGDVPDSALTPDIKQLRERGMDRHVTLEYEFRQGEFVVRKTGPGGPMEKRFNYQIAQEFAGKLVLERDAEDSAGEPKRIHAAIDGMRLRIGSGRTALDLRRK